MNNIPVEMIEKNEQITRHNNNVSIFRNNTFEDNLDEIKLYYRNKYNRNHNILIVIQLINQFLF